MRLVNLILLLSAILLPSFVFGDDVYIVIAKKQEAKKNVSWNLADWMDTKKKIALMDQWLAMNSSVSWFEFYMGGDFSDYRKRVDNSEDVTYKNYHYDQGYFAAYLSIFGLEARMETANEKYKARQGQGMIRLLGKSAQSTNLTLVGGIRKTTDSLNDDVYRNAFLGGEATLYIFRYFGFNGSYRYYYPQHSHNAVNVLGQLKEGGAFLDLSFLRIYGTWFKEELRLKTENTTLLTREGIRGGAMIFF